MAVGCVAGDAQSYILFCDFFDRVIEAHQGHKMTKSQKSDFNYANLKGGDNFDSAYVLSCEVRVSRNVEDFSFPTHCSRAERRQLLTLARRVLSQVGAEFPGRLYPLGTGRVGGRPKVEPPSDLMIKTGVARDWPLTSEPC
ncbi:hypothetical protein AAFF_G00302450 [Aldrovandia affinis]|uniref:creatine kinase n=1 Tax=Aldrovandia affinis TaxID=143900 RepID=A0AAD7R8Y7_9TELE|nr:hypothetical protein AAFF_G00302450 [Aldrovandia affinis]